MKNTIRIAFALALVATFTTALRAQSGDVTGGSLTISLDPTLWALLDANGITTKLGPAVADVAHSDAILTGLFDMPTGSGYFTTKGRLQLTGPDGELVTVLQLGIDTTGVTPVVFGYVYAHDYYLRKQPIFNIVTMDPLKAPLTAGTNKSGDFYAVLSPYFQNLLGTTFHTSILLGYMGITTLHTSISLTPAP